jgi:hypothetical protein
VAAAGTDTPARGKPVVPAAAGTDTGGRGNHGRLPPVRERNADSRSSHAPARHHDADWHCYIASPATEHAAELDRQSMHRVLTLPGDLWLDVCGDDTDH